MLAAVVALRIFGGKELDEFLLTTSFVEIECLQVDKIGRIWMKNRKL